MSVHDDEARLVRLLAPLQRIEPLSTARRRRLRRRRPLLVAALAAAALAVTGVAIAAGLGAFDGISAASHAPTAADALDANTAAMIGRYNADEARQAGNARVPDRSIDLGSARLVGQLPDGHKLYAATDTPGDLCVIVEQMVISCGPPLDSDEPTTLVTTDADGPGGTPPLSYSIARDGVTALSFQAHGTEVTIPVSHNVWAYEGESSLLESFTVHYADGTTTTISH